MKIDDIVLVNQSFENLAIAGRSGIIKDMLSSPQSSDSKYLVKFDISSNIYLHNGNGVGEYEYVSDNNDCYWFSDTELQLIDKGIEFSYETIKSDSSLFYLKNKIDALISRFGENSCYRIMNETECGSLGKLEISHWK